MPYLGEWGMREGSESTTRVLFAACKVVLEQRRRGGSNNKRGRRGFSMRPRKGGFGRWVGWPE